MIWYMLNIKQLDKFLSVDIIIYFSCIIQEIFFTLILVHEYEKRARAGRGKCKAVERRGDEQIQRRWAETSPETVTED